MSRLVKARQAEKAWEDTGREREDFFMLEFGHIYLKAHANAASPFGQGQGQVSPLLGARK